jgi:acylphosphatase
MTRDALSETAATVEMTITGALGGAGFPDWIRHRARLLSVRGAIRVDGPGRIRLRLSGAPELLDALAVACSLGPAAALVDAVETAPAAPGDAPAEFEALEPA